MTKLFDEIKKYDNLGKSILRKIKKKRRYGQECKCEDQDELFYYIDGEETQEFCLICGGYICQHEW